MVKDEKDIDMSYFSKLKESAIETINKFCSLEDLIKE
jgi:hypothetical protein